jgi:hypothetical protein
MTVKLYQIVATVMSLQPSLPYLADPPQQGGEASSLGLHELFEGVEPSNTAYFTRIIGWYTEDLTQDNKTGSRTSHSCLFRSSRSFFWISVSTQLRSTVDVRLLNLQGQTALDVHIHLWTRLLIYIVCLSQPMQHNSRVLVDPNKSRSNLGADPQSCRTHAVCFWLPPFCCMDLCKTYEFTVGLTP